MGKDSFKYIALCIGIYLSLALIIFYPLAPLLDFFGFGFKGRLVLHLIFLLIINPILTWFIADRFRFKENTDEGDELL